MKKTNKTLEQLIQHSLADDMLLDLESKYTSQVQEYFDTRQEETSLSIPDFSWMQPFLEWISKPTVSYAVTAAVFACMMIACAFTYISNERNALATTIDTIQLTANVFSAIETAHAMTVKTLRIEAKEGNTTCTIAWENGMSRIDFEDGETWIISNDKTEIRHPGQEHTVIKSTHETAVLFSSPEKIKNQLIGKWKVSKKRDKDDVELVHVLVMNLREGHLIQLWVEPSTYLPIRIETPAAELPGGRAVYWDTIQVDLGWNQTVELEAKPFLNPSESGELK